MKIDDLTKYFTRKKVNLFIVVGHCEKGKYLVVPPEFFGTPTILLKDDQYEFQLMNVLERNIEKNIITKEMIEAYEKDKVRHLVNHISNGNHIVKLHYVNLQIYVDTLNDDSLDDYLNVVSYIILKQRFHDAKMELRWANSLKREELKQYYGYDNDVKIQNKNWEYENLKMSYLQSRILAKHNCKTKERFEVMIKLYWHEENAKLLLNDME